MNIFLKKFLQIKKITFLLLSIPTFTILSACGSQSTNMPVQAQAYTPPSTENKALGAPQKETEAKMATKTESAAKAKGSRDNTPKCLIPEASGVDVNKNEYAHIDTSNAKEGYIIVKYTGNSPKVKLQITGPDKVVYTYNLNVKTPTDEVFPLQSGNGEYMINVFENIEGTQYATVMSHIINVNIENTFGPFLYPNQYCKFSSTSNVVKKAQELSLVCNNDLEVVTEIYNFIISNIKYDYAEAETVESGYLPNVDEVLSTKKGICLDYASLMTSMLRSQNIPTRMEVGYAGEVYHAWISTYIKDIGWVNGIVQFDGKDWSLMDPTFASNTNEKELKNFIGDGKNYSVKYIY